MGIRFVQSKAGRHYDFDEPTFGHFEVQESTLSTLQVQAFQTELKHINHKNWDEEYMDPFILDGTQWQMKNCFEDGGVRELFGSNAYPPQWDQCIHFKSLHC